MSGSKPWDRPWSMEEMIENSDSWNLAGDVALLNTLKAFADKLLSEATEINNNLKGLTNNLDETSLRLNIAQNEFQSLRNSQFIESRVYEDDESLPQVETVPKVEEKSEIDRNEEVRLAALKGLEVLEQYFDKVEVSVSDSEDDDIDLPNFVMRPKDLYIHRPLPYVIGSDEWHKKWHVGLEDSSSDSETEKVSDKFSESDSESDLPIIQDRSSQIKGTSDTSSELDFSQRNEQKGRDFFNSSDSVNSVPSQAPIVGKNFAEQLTAKLGNVINQQEPEVNRRPIQPPKSNYGDIFFDEPPPLDEPKGLFSGSGGLFDDEVEEPPKISPSPKIGPSKGLFDGGDSSDDDIFSKKVPPITKTPLFSEEPPVLEEKKKPVGGVSIFGAGNLFDKKLLRRRTSSEDEAVEPKKVDLFGDDDLFTPPPKPVTGGQKATKKVNLFDSDEESEPGGMFGEEKNEDKNDTKAQEKKKVSLFDAGEDEVRQEKKVSLFDAGEDEVRQEKKVSLFDAGEDEVRQEKKVSLFDDSEDEVRQEKKVSLFDAGEDEVQQEKKVSLFNDGKNEVREEKKVSLFETGKDIPEEKKVSLFDDDDGDLFKDDLFSTKTTKSFTSGLFDDIPSDDLFAPNTEKPEPPGNLFDDLVIIPENNSINVQTKEDPKPRLALFDSPPPEPDDLFGNPSPPPSSTPNMPLFDPSPPPDDDWDTKSDHFSETEVFPNETSYKPSLFSEEPPEIDFKPQPSPRNKPGKLTHNLNINVGALLPGSAPPKRGTTPPEEVQKDFTPLPKKVGFDEPDKVEVLHSVTKDRAKVPLKRRPSTRKGRKAALENATTDFKLEQEDVQKVPLEQEIKTVEDVQKVPLEQEIKPEDVRTVPKEAEIPSKVSLFDDEDDEDDLFTSKRPVYQTKPKKSLFDDDDDDDIFKSFSSTSVKKTEIKVATEKKVPKVTTTVKKLENTKPDDDPLSALLK